MFHKGEDNLRIYRLHPPRERTIESYGQDSYVSYDEPLVYYMRRDPARTTIGSRNPATSAQVGLTCNTASLYWRNTESADGSRYCRIASRKELSEADLQKGLQWHRCARPTGRARIGTTSGIRGVSTSRSCARPTGRARIGTSTAK